MPCVIFHGGPSAFQINKQRRQRFLHSGLESCSAVPKPANRPKVHISQCQSRAAITTDVRGFRGASTTTNEFFYVQLSSRSLSALSLCAIVLSHLPLCMGFLIVLLSHELIPSVGVFFYSFHAASLHLTGRESCPVMERYLGSRTHCKENAWIGSSHGQGR